jgi:carbonic anhydrase
MLFDFLKLTTSKTRQFGDTSSFFEVDNTKNAAILRDVLQRWTVECRADDLVPIRFTFFLLSIGLKYCACHKKNRWQVIRSAAPVSQNHLSKPEDLMLQNAT